MITPNRIVKPARPPFRINTLIGLMLITAFCGAVDVTGELLLGLSWLALAPVLMLVLEAFQFLLTRWDDAQEQQSPVNEPSRAAGSPKHS